MDGISVSEYENELDTMGNEENVPHLRWYRQERPRGNNVFAEDKKLIRSKVR